MGNAREQIPKRLSVRDWVRILSQALIISEEKRSGKPIPFGNYGTPFYLIPLKPKRDGEKNG